MEMVLINCPVRGFFIWDIFYLQNNFLYVKIDHANASVAQLARAQPCQG